jgi:hypothetical protein
LGVFQTRIVSFVDTAGEAGCGPSWISGRLLVLLRQWDLPSSLNGIQVPGDVFLQIIDAPLKSVIRVTLPILRSINSGTAVWPGRLAIRVESSLLGYRGAVHPANRAALRCTTSRIFAMSTAMPGRPTVANV